MTRVHLDLLLLLAHIGSYQEVSVDVLGVVLFSSRPYPRTRLQSWQQTPRQEATHSDMKHTLTGVRHGLLRASQEPRIPTLKFGADLPTLRRSIQGGSIWIEESLTR